MRKQTINNNKRYYTAREFADILDVPTRDIYQMVKAGIIQPLSEIGSYRFTKDEIDNYIKRFYVVKLYPKGKILEDIANRAAEGEPLDYIMILTKIPKSIIKRVIKIIFEIKSPGTGRGKALLLKGAAGFDRDPAALNKN